MEDLRRFYFDEMQWKEIDRKYEIVTKKIIEKKE